MKSLASAKTVEEIRARLGGFVETDQRRWGAMSPTETARHLRGAFEMATGERAMKSISGPMPKSLMKAVALWMPMHWPRSLPTVPELFKTEVLRGGFGEEKRAMMAAYERFLGMREKHTEHPMLGAMGPGEWMRWGYLHTDHHLRQFGR